MIGKNLLYNFEHYDLNKDAKELGSKIWWKNRHSSLDANLMVKSCKREIFRVRL